MSAPLQEPEVFADQLGSTYVTADDRYVVSLIVGYGDNEVANAEEAAAGALDLTRDLGSLGTMWFVHDRQTGETRRLEQEDFEPKETT